MTFDPNIVTAILAAGIGGLPVRAVVALIKNQFGLTGIAVIAVTLVACAAATALYLAIAGFTWWGFAIYTAFVFMSSQGWYQTTKAPA